MLSSPDADDEDAEPCSTLSDTATALHLEEETRIDTARVVRACSAGGRLEFQASRKETCKANVTIVVHHTRSLLMPSGGCVFPMWTPTFI